jgi:hypothetical protein
MVFITHMIKLSYEQLALVLGPSNVKFEPNSKVVVDAINDSNIFANELGMINVLGISMTYSWTAENQYCWTTSFGWFLDVLPLFLSTQFSWLIGLDTSLIFYRISQFDFDYLD